MSDGVSHSPEGAGFVSESASKARSKRAGEKSRKVTYKRNDSLSGAGAAARSDKKDGERPSQFEHKNSGSREPEHSELIYETEVQLQSADIKFKVEVFRKKDGSYAMNQLPTNKYDEETIKRIISESGIRENVSILPDWDKKTTEEKIAYLKTTFNLSTVEGGKNYRPVIWGYQDPNRQPDGHEPYGHFVSEMEFRDLLLEKWDTLGQPPNPNPLVQQQNLLRLAEIEGAINNRIQSQQPEWVVSAYMDYTALKKEVKKDPVRQAELDQIFTPAQQAALDNSKELIDQHFENVLQTAGDASVSDIKSTANQELAALGAGWRNVDDSISILMREMGSKRDIPGRRGLRAWFAFRQVEMLIEAHEVLKRTEVHADPLENIRAASDVMNFFEKSKTIEVFGLAREKLVRMLQAVENSADVRVTPELKLTLRKRFDSFEKMNSLLITMDDSEGDSHAMHEAAVKFDDENWYYFYNRFGSSEVRDREGNLYLVDQAGNELKNLNLAGEAENAFAYQYLADRWRVNRVQELMTSDLDPNNPINPDEAWIINRVNHKIQTMLAKEQARVPQNVDLVNRLRAAAADINVLWDVGGTFDREGVWNSNDDEYQKIRKDSVREWYREATWLGADGDDPNTGRRRLDFWQDWIIHNHLRSRLLDSGVAGDKVNALLGTLARPGLEYNAVKFIDVEHKNANPDYNPLGRLTDPNQPYDAVMNPVVEESNVGDYDLITAAQRNGYDLAKFKYADTLDRFRIYTRDGVQLDTDWGEDTPYQARAVTHFMDWALNEGQGDPRVVRDIIAQMDRSWQGQILAQNVTGERFFSIEGVLEVEGVLREELRSRVTAEAQRTESPERDVEGYVWTSQIMEGINPYDLQNPGLNIDLTRINWGEASKNIKSYPVHDMLDDRQKVFGWYTKEYVNWLKNPFPAQFQEMMKNYYSGRNVRKHPGTEFFLEAQWVQGQQWVDRFGVEQNMTQVDLQALVQFCVENSLIDRTRADRLVTRLLGSEFKRATAQAAELVREGARQTVGSPGWWAGGLFDGAWTLMKFMATGK